MSKNIFFNQFIINTIKVNTKDMVKIIIKRNLSVDVNMYSVSKELCISTSLLKKERKYFSIIYVNIIIFFNICNNISVVNNVDIIF